MNYILPSSKIKMYLLKYLIIIISSLIIQNIVNGSLLKSKGSDFALDKPNKFNKRHVTDSKIIFD